jgi:hypothetical protein
LPVFGCDINALVALTPNLCSTSNYDIRPSA